MIVAQRLNFALRNVNKFVEDVPVRNCVPVLTPATCNCFRSAFHPVLGELSIPIQTNGKRDSGREICLHNLGLRNERVTERQNKPSKNLSTLCMF